MKTTFCFWVPFQEVRSTRTRTSISDRSPAAQTDTAGTQTWEFSNCLPHLAQAWLKVTSTKNAHVGTQVHFFCIADNFSDSIDIGYELLCISQIWTYCSCLRSDVKFIIMRNLLNCMLSSLKIEIYSKLLAQTTHSVGIFIYIYICNECNHGSMNSMNSGRPPESWVTRNSENDH